MDDNTMKLIDELLTLHEDLAELQAKQKALLKLIWSEELKEAKGAQRYGSRYTKIEDTTIRAVDIRDIFEFGPCPGAVEIYNDLKATEDGDSDDSL